MTLPTPTPSCSAAWQGNKLRHFITGGLLAGLYRSWERWEDPRLNLPLPKASSQSTPLPQLLTSY